MELAIAIDGATGRTAFLPSVSEPAPSISYRTRVLNTRLLSKPLVLQSLVEDAIALDDASVSARTHFMAPNVTPSCLFESLAKQVWMQHMGELPSCYLDESRSGVEWWVQVRPSGMSSWRFNKNDSKGEGRLGINWHWDKDENLRDLAGGLLISLHWFRLSLNRPLVFKQAEFRSIRTSLPSHTLQLDLLLVSVLQRQR
jgi:hypothetical protein